MLDVAHCRLYPAGADGSATVTAAKADWDKRVEGEIKGISIDLTTQPNTVDVTIPHPNNAGINLFAKSNLSADYFAVPGIFSVSNADSGLSSDVTPQKYQVWGYPAAVFAQGDAGASKYVDIWITFERGY